MGSERKRRSRRSSTSNLNNKLEKKNHESIIEFISSGSDLVDLALGGGFGRGVIINIVGDASSGKTLLACETIHRARADHSDTTWFYDNAEAGFSFDTELMYGFRMLPENEEDRSTTVEDFIDRFSSKMALADEAKKKLIYILDSLDALTCDAELKRANNRKEARMKGNKYDQGTYNLEKNKLIGEFFRLNCNEIERTKTTLIIISQTRENIGVIFGQKWRVASDGALRFYAKQRILLKEITKIKETIEGKEYETGIVIKVRVFKNKLGVPFKVCDFEILFNYGVDNIGSNLDYLFDLKTKTDSPVKNIPSGIDGYIKMPSYDGKEFLRRLDLINEIEGSEENKKWLTNEVKKKWNEITKALEPKRVPKYG